MACTENEPSPTKEQPSTLESAYYMFLQASDIFPGSITGQGVFIASVCKIHDLYPQELGEVLLSNPTKLKGIVGIARRSHSASRLPVEKTTLEKVRGTVKLSFEFASDAIGLPQSALNEIGRNYDAFMTPKDKPLSIRETNYRQFADNIIKKHAEENL